MANEDAHREFSAGCFNACWEYIDKADRTPEDVENMRLLAYASLWHWKQRADCSQMNLSVGYWQAARVEALAGNAELARESGEKCLRAAQEGKLSPYYVGYGYEALARAELAAGNRDAAREHLASARSELEKVTDAESADLLRADLDGVADAAAS
jgi:hypothetical protein